MDLIKWAWSAPAAPDGAGGHQQSGGVMEVRLPERLAHPGVSAESTGGSQARQIRPAARGGYSPDRKAEHAEALLGICRGDLHADGYAGFAGLYAADPKTPIPRLMEVACWAHARRKIHDVHAATGSGVAQEILPRMGALFEIEA